MSYRIVQKIAAEELFLSHSELSARMQVPRDYDMTRVQPLIEKLLAEIDCRMTAVKVPVTITGDAVELGICRVKSRDLAYILRGSNQAYIFAVTLGMDVERYLLKLSKISVGDHFVADAIASAYAESAADRASEILSVSAKLKKRFSPGYGDLPLEIQKDILGALSAEKNIGITLTDTLLMKPQKSITAIAGIENE